MSYEDKLLEGVAHGVAFHKDQGDVALTDGTMIDMKRDEDERFLIITMRVPMPPEIPPMHEHGNAALAEIVGFCRAFTDAVHMTRGKGDA